MASFIVGTLSHKSQDIPILGDSLHRFRPNRKDFLMGFIRVHNQNDGPVIPIAGEPCYFGAGRIPALAEAVIRSVAT